jgi:hypothetical protein
VAHSVAASLLSRNSDVAGYWAIGQLLAHALVTNSYSYRIDLLCGTSSPTLVDTPLDHLAGAWSDLFLSNLQKHGLTKAQTSQATAALELGLSTQRIRSLPPHVAENPITCRIRVEDDRGKVYFGTSEVWAFPHDPSHERRSMRGV